MSFNTWDQRFKVLLPGDREKEREKKKMLNPIIYYSSSNKSLKSLQDDNISANEENSVTFLLYFHHLTMFTANYITNRGKAS